MRPGALADHVSLRGLSHQVPAAQMGRDHRVPVLRRHLVKHVVARDSRVAGQHVNPLPLLADGLERASDLIG